MFGLKRKLQTAITELAASLPPTADLAAELMPAFGPDGPRHGKDLCLTDLDRWVLSQMLPQYQHRLSEQSLKLLRALTRAGGTVVPLGLEELGGIGDAIQLLEHAELVYYSIRDERPNCWNATQLGSATLARGKAAVRQHIKDRTGATSAIDPSTATLPRPSVAQRLQELETLRATGVITDAEYAAKREQIIGEI
jgi:hypothetical protein